MTRRGPNRRAMSLVELLVVIAILGVLFGLILPAVSSERETARRTQCANHLKQIGIGLHAYHGSYSEFPSGHVAELDGGGDGKSWGWGALLLPFIEEGPLADRLDPTRLSFDVVASDPARAPLLLTNVDLYRCPSDQGDDLAHRFRSIIIPGRVTDLLALAPPPPGGRAPGGLVLGHVFMPPILPPLPDPPPGPPDPPPPGPTGGFAQPARVAKSNYVGSIGNRWKPQRQDWGDADFEGNGLFGRNSAVRKSQVLDGASKTLAVGERSDRNYAAVWAGGNSWSGCGFADNQMVLGAAFYPINDAPVTENIDCDGRGSANFSSYHPGGANFVFADGSVRFLPEQIDRGVFGNLAQRNDGQSIGDF